MKITVFRSACLVVCAGAAIAQEVRIQGNAFDRAERALREPRIPEARELYTEAGRTVVEQGSPDLPEWLLEMGMLASMATSLHGEILAKIGKLESGEQLAKRALEGARRVTHYLGKGHTIHTEHQV